LQLSTDWLLFEPIASELAQDGVQTIAVRK
jgi:hypothetical protein